MVLYLLIEIKNSVQWIGISNKVIESELHINNMSSFAELKDLEDSLQQVQNRQLLFSVNAAMIGSDLARTLF